MTGEIVSVARLQDMISDLRVKEEKRPFGWLPFAFAEEEIDPTESRAEKDNYPC